MSSPSLPRWEKRGLVFAPPGTGWMRSHAMLPTPLVLPDRIRVFFAACDADLRGRIFRVDLDRDDPRRILELGDAPALDLGPPGAFDADGVNPSQILTCEGRLILCYIGWQRLSAEVPYTLFAGLAESEDGGLSFHRRGGGQILHPASEERYFRTAPFIFPAPGGWGMLYIGGGTFFDGKAGKRIPIYSLCRADSADGRRWDAPPRPALLDPDPGQGEIGFGRPVLWQEGDAMTLLVSVRTQDGYTQRQARLEAGVLRWDTVLDGAAEEWESLMTEFAAPCRAGAWEYLFYNGNQFGRLGFGVARRPAQAAGPAVSAAPLLEALERANRGAAPRDAS
jgi:hypothetical protein